VVVCRIEWEAILKTVKIREAKAQLSRLIAQACAGEDIVIARGKTPVVRLVPIDPPPKRRVSGALKGKLVVGPEFFEPLPDDELDAWEQ
jgi:prevent-host-death family protein